MSFLNSLSTRIPLALIGGILYGQLAYSVFMHLGLSQFNLPAAVLVFLFYFGSRLLILFSGVDSPYYSKKEIAYDPSFEGSAFYRTAQWVGKFYHFHDIVLFAFLVAISIAFLITLMVDWSGAKPIGSTLREIYDALASFLNKDHKYVLLT